MRLIPCQSSNLTGVAYEPGSAKFYICFKGGSVYEYECYGARDPIEYATAMVTDVLFAKSQGSAFTTGVKDNSLLPYRKLSLEEIAELELEV